MYSIMLHNICNCVLYQHHLHNGSMNQMPFFFFSFIFKDDETS